MKVNRRNFLWQAGALAAGGLFLPGCTNNNSGTATGDATEKTEGVSQTNAPPLTGRPVGLQLYTVREQMDKDTKGTLQQIAQIGYKELEAAAGAKGHYYGMPPQEFAAMVTDLGMKVVSSHVLVGTQTQKEAPLPATFPTLTSNLQKLVDMAAAAGQEYLVCAYLFASERTKLDQYKHWIELFNKAGEACNKAGLQFAYHNHDFEFETLEGQVPYDLILSQTDADKVKMELDLYWVSKFGKDPVALFQQHEGRFPLWHVKDMDKTEKKFFTEVGNGTIDFKRIFAASETAGMKHFFVEQDQTPGNPVDSITTSYKNLTNILA